MSKKFIVNEVDKEERIRKHDQKRKSKQRDRTREAEFEKKAKNRKVNKNNWLKNYDIYDDEDEYYHYEF